ncbi:MAG TPA: translation elongation factor Ts [Actinobacteria bacterium]|nr:translation elongation factor Ts [Actinomycetota bacterium]
MTVSAAQVKKLRDSTGAGMMDCKSALVDAKGDIEKAIEILRKKGAATLSKKAGRVANEGIISSYIHAGNKLGVLLEVNCETDFVARNEDFKIFAHDIAMHIAASSPIWISRDQVPPGITEKEKEIYKEQALNEGKPEGIVDKIAEGKMEKFYERTCLLEQPFVKNQDLTIREYLAEIVGKIGENIVIERFTRYLIGEEND